MTDLWLFDIDGTLVDTKDIQVAATKLDYKEALGIDVSTEIILSKFGLPERPTHIAILKELGLEPEESLVDKLTNNHTSNFQKVIRPIKEIEPLDGVVEFLTYLQNHKEYLGVVTGNLKEPAELIMEKSNLMRFFPIVSYDDGHSERQQIVQRAIDEAKARNYNFNKVVVIDDTPRGIEAGKYVGAFVVAVATGTDGIEKLRGKIKQLQYERSSIVVSSLKDYMTIVNQINET